MSAVGINGRNRQQLRVAHQIKIGPAISWQSASWAFDCEGPTCALPGYGWTNFDLMRHPQLLAIPAVGINGRNRQQLRVAHQIKIGPAISWQSASWAFAIVPRGKQVNDTFAVAAMIGAITGRRAHHGILIYAADSAIDLSAPAII